MRPENLSIDFRSLFAYSDNCRRVLRETLEAHPEAFNRTIEPPLIDFKTIRDVVVHTCGAEERWIVMRIQGQEIGFYRDRAPDSIAAIFEDWDRNRAVTNRFVETLSESDLQRVYRFKLGDVWEGDLTVRQILMHILNHETHHRAQISMALQQMGIDPPDFDFIFLSE